MNLTSVKTIKEIKDRFGFTFKKGLGQNFLTDPSVLDSAVLAAEIENGVLEIGPGFGVLTYALAQTGKKVISLEIDERLIPVLDYTLSEFDNVKIINRDVMKTDIRALIEEEFGEGRISIAANLPYYITTPIITTLLEKKLPVNNMVFMVQREVAERIVAIKGRDAGAISLFCRYFSEPEIIEIVPAGSFYPPPKVDSALLKLKILDKPSVEVVDEKLLFKIIRASFSQRRKTLANGISSGIGMPKNEVNELLVSLGFSETIRGEALTLSDFARISDKISEIKNKE